MKHFLIILLVVSPFFATSQVSIKPETAMYYLEIEDRYFMELEKDTIQDQLIEGLRNESKAKDKIILTMEELVGLKDSLVVTKEEQITLKEEEINLLKKEVRRHKIEKVGTVIGALLLIILI